eukprot:PLAT2986.1.p1 GENE.PLAT2986.1~~PLAT2986.1.p1  ORF type:complete len:178 (-),score=51.23 PLAT2986.1:95-628(-)
MADVVEAGDGRGAESKAAEDAAASEEVEVTFRPYESEAQLPAIAAMIAKELSEPYSVLTYRYFLNNWPNLAIVAHIGEKAIGCIVGKADETKRGKRGYIAMLVVEKEHRRRGLGSKLVKQCIARMVEDGCNEIYLETEISNKKALSLYSRLGFLRDRRLKKYYLNGGDAFRLTLWLD